MVPSAVKEAVLLGQRERFDAPGLADGLDHVEMRIEEYGFPLAAPVQAHHDVHLVPAAVRRQIRRRR